MSNNNPTATILIVDDVESNIDTLVRILDEYDLIPATSGADALAILQSEAVDLVLLDIIMPGLDGFEVCRRIKADKKLQDLPIIFITAKSDDHSIETAFAAGGYDYVTKPFKAPELLARVKTQLTLNQQYKTLQAQNRELTRIETALLESEERYRLAMNASRDGLWDWDISSNKVYYSTGWTNILGLDDVAQEYSSWEKRIHPEDHDTIIKSLQMHLEGKSDHWHEEHRLLRGDGNWVWVTGRGQVTHRDADGKPIRMIGTMIDITRHKQKQELDEVRQQLAEQGYDLELADAMRIALDAAETMSASQVGFYHLIEEDQETISLQVWSTRTSSEMCSVVNDYLHHSVDKAGLWADSIRQGRPLRHNDYAASTHQHGLPPGHPEIQRFLTVPVARKGRVVSIIGVAGKPIGYDERDQEIVTAVAEMAQNFFERRRFEQRIEYMAFNDTLTGLPNRELLMDRMHQAVSLSRRSDQLVAVCYMDLDGFKPVNDSFGHHVGDELLIQLGKRLSKELREGDTLARLGGDEFVVLLTALESIADGEAIISRILEMIRNPFVLKEHTVSISASIGVTFYPNDDNEPETLLRHADQAMYQVKQDQKSDYRLFDLVLAEKSNEENLFLQEIETALRENQLELYYQPRVNLATGEVASVESLLRWNHPVRGLLTAESFLPMFASSADETRLNEWVLKNTLQQYSEWSESGLNLPISINISSRFIRDKAFALFLAKLLSEYPEEVAHKIELEVVDTNALRKPDEIAETMKQFARLGLQFSLDDFGNGYESLSYFHLLPINVLKIDRSFIHRMLDNEANLDVVEGMLRLAHGLKRPAVAEGVESLEIGLMLLQLGCQYAQGFSIARPMPAADIPAWLTSWDSDNVWHNLNQEVHGVSETYDVNVSIFSHRRWLKQVENYLRDDAKASELPPLDGRHCQFERWYRGLGLMRYGKNPVYSRIAPAHSKVHEVASTLVDLFDKGSKDDALHGIAELEEASGQMVSLLRQLD